MFALPLKNSIKTPDCAIDLLKTLLHYSWFLQTFCTCISKKRNFEMCMILSICFTSGFSSCYLMCPTDCHSGFSRRLSLVGRLQPASFNPIVFWAIQKLFGLKWWRKGRMKKRKNKVGQRELWKKSGNDIGNRTQKKVKIKAWIGGGCLEMEGIKNVDRWRWEVASPVPH